MKKYIIIAGVNGAGKSTLLRTQSNIKNMPRINSDEILKLFGDWRNSADLAKAGKLAVKKLKEYLDAELSFAQETTLCGRSFVRTIKTAINKGYSIEMHYVGLDSPEIAKERVKYRVSRKGHGIPDADIDRRYRTSFENLQMILPLCNLVALYDNTVDFRRFAIYKDGDLLRLSPKTPSWYRNFSAKSTSSFKMRGCTLDEFEQDMRETIAQGVNVETEENALFILSS